jgi:mRNA-degrading endonuclease RelE of RelBE toxin-antitoxin system
MSGDQEKGRIYSIEMTKAAHRIYKKLDPPVQRRIKDETHKIAQAPHNAPMLQGLPLSVRSHHFTFNGVNWRIAYVTDDVAAKLTVVLLGVRENFYDRLKRLL